MNMEGLFNKNVNHSKLEFSLDSGGLSKRVNPNESNISSKIKSTSSIAITKPRPIKSYNNFHEKVEKMLNSNSVPNKPEIGSLPDPSSSFHMPALNLPPTPMEESELLMNIAPTEISNPEIQKPTTSDPINISDSNITKPKEGEVSELLLGEDRDCFKPRSLIHVTEGLHVPVAMSLDYATSCPPLMASFPSDVMEDMSALNKNRNMTSAVNSARSSAVPAVPVGSYTAFSMLGEVSEEGVEADEEGCIRSRYRSTSSGYRSTSNSIDYLSGGRSRRRTNTFESSLDDEMTFALES